MKLCGRRCVAYWQPRARTAIESRSIRRCWPVWPGRTVMPNFTRPATIPKTASKSRHSCLPCPLNHGETWSSNLTFPKMSVYEYEYVRCTDSWRGDGCLFALTDFSFNIIQKHLCEMQQMHCLNFWYFCMFCLGVLSCLLLPRLLRSKASFLLLLLRCPWKRRTHSVCRLLWGQFLLRPDGSSIRTPLTMYGSLFLDGSFRKGKVTVLYIVQNFVTVKQSHKTEKRKAGNMLCYYLTCS